VQDGGDGAGGSECFAGARVAAMARARGWGGDFVDGDGAGAGGGDGSVPDEVLEFGREEGEGGEGGGGGGCFEGDAGFDGLHFVRVVLGKAVGVGWWMGDEVMDEGRVALASSNEGAGAWVFK
jgi:hypothetical protein